MKELRKRLSFSYMTMSEHFNEAFSFMKYFFRTEKKWTSAVIVLGLLTNLILLDREGNETLTFLVGIISIVHSFLMLFLLKKVMEVIEEKTDISYGRMVMKSILLGLFTFIIIIFPIIFIVVVIIESGIGAGMLAFLFLSAIIASVTITYFTLYFNTIYFTRDTNMIDSFKYNLHLSKGNRLKIFIPTLIYYSIFFSILIVVSIINYIIGIALINHTVLSFIFFLVVGIVSGLFFNLAGIYMIILNVIIYLNVEYMDLNKKKEYYFEENDETENPISENNYPNGADNSDSRSNSNILNIPVAEYYNEFSKLNVRKGEEKDIKKIMEILEKAKNEIRNMGISQWQKGYPDMGTVLDDIQKGNSYVLEENGNIIATAALLFEKETSYSDIGDGEWLVDNDYGTIHRIAVDSELKNKGYASEFLKKLEETVRKTGRSSVRADTHEGNAPMIAFLEKNGYTYCGVIYLDKGPETGEKRLAFEKRL